MKRRQFIRNVSAGAAGLAVSPLPFVQKANAQPTHPNVLFILLEDAPNWFGCLGGHPDTMTPNIDELANRGCLFTNAHCASPICNPSRTALLTGQYPNTTGVFYNDDDWREIIPNVVSMPRYFLDHDYFTVRSGKVYHGNFDEREVWNQYIDAKATHNLPGEEPYLPGHPWNGLNYLLEGDGDATGTQFFNWGATDAPEAIMTDFRRVRNLNEMLQDGMREPFLMFYGTHKAHFPAIAPRRVMERFNIAEVTLPPVNPTDLDDLPPSAFNFIEPWHHEDVVNGKQWHKAVAAYLATIHYMDEMVGRLLNQFDHSPHANNTIVVLVADHGFHLGEKMHWRKATLWNESSSVIMTVLAPGVTTPGSVCHQPVNMLDLYPTLVDLCNLPANPANEGQSLRPLLENPASVREEPSIMTLEAGNHAVITEQWHYIHYANGDRELYDRNVDPQQWDNLATNPDYEPIMQQLRDWIPDDWIPPTDAIAPRAR
ncbi:sulfatase [bacterium]|nr:sulfatase [bacterium]